MLSIQRSFLLLFTVLCIAGCSNGPSGNQIDQILESYSVENEVEGIFIIKNVRKTNGYILNDIYNLEIEFERHFLVGIDDAIKKLNKEITSSKPSNAVEEMQIGLLGVASGAGFMKMMIANQWGNFSRGDVYDVSDVIKFIKTENGWQIYYE